MNAFVLAHQTFFYSHIAAKKQLNSSSEAAMIFLIFSETNCLKQQPPQPFMPSESFQFKSNWLSSLTTLLSSAHLALIVSLRSCARKNACWI